jgi:hypothetical protein
LDARFAGAHPVTEADEHFWGITDNPLVYEDLPYDRHRKADLCAQPSCEKLVSENPTMLWIVPKLDYIEVPIVTPH